MIPRNLTAIAFAAFGLAACATVPVRPSPAPPGAPAPGPLPDEPRPSDTATADPDQEAVYSVAMGRAGLTARVNSNGCTKRSDFKVQVLDGYPAPTVILTRARPDLCKSLVAGGVDLLFTYGEMRLKPTSPIVLANPLIADPTPGR